MTTDAVRPYYGPEEIRCLPMLVSYGDLIRCGIPKADIPRLVASGRLTFCRVNNKSRRRYHRQAVEKVLGLL